MFENKYQKLYDSASFKVLIILVGRLYFPFLNDDLDQKNHKETGYENHFVRPLYPHTYKGKFQRYLGIPFLIYRPA